MRIEDVFQKLKSKCVESVILQRFISAKIGMFSTWCFVLALVLSFMDGIMELLRRFENLTGWMAVLFDLGLIIDTVWVVVSTWMLLKMFVHKQIYLKAIFFQVYGFHFLMSFLLDIAMHLDPAECIFHGVMGAIDLWLATTYLKDNVEQSS